MAFQMYSIGDFITIESEIDLLLLDTEVDGGNVDFHIRQGQVPSPAESDKIGGSSHFQYYWNDAGQSVIDDRDGDGRAEIQQDSDTVEITVTPEYAELNSKTVPFSRAGFTKLLLSVIQYGLLQQNATIGYAAAAESSNGRGFLFFAGGERGKSTSIFHLATDQGFRVLSDDLVIIHQNEVYPFPRYIDLPLDVPSIADDLDQLREKHSSEIQKWPGEVSIPRRFISTVPSSITAEYCFFLSPNRIPFSPSSEMPADKAVRMAIARNQAHASNWTTYDPVRYFFDHHTQQDYRDDRDKLIQEAVKDASSYKVTISDPVRIPDIVVDILESS